MPDYEPVVFAPNRPLKSTTTPQATIPGFEPGARTRSYLYTPLPVPRDRFWGFGCIDISTFKLQWFTEIWPPAESYANASYDPVMLGTSPVLYKEAIVSGVRSGEFGEYLHIYNLKKDGTYIKSSADSSENDIFKIYDRKTRLVCTTNNDLMMDASGNVWWLEYPAQTLYMGNPAKTNISLVRAAHLDTAVASP